MSFPLVLQFLLRRWGTRVANFVSLIRLSVPSKPSPPQSFLCPPSNQLYYASSASWVEVAFSYNNLALVRSSRVTHAHHLTSSWGLKHEALQLQIEIAATDTHPAHTAWLLVERLHSDEWHQPEPPLPSSSSPSLDQPSSLEADRVDRIVVHAGYSARRAYHGYRTRRTLQLPADAAFSVADAMALVLAVYSSSKTYHITDRNCSWVVGSAYTCIERQYSGTTTNGKPLTAGHFGHFRISPDRPDVLENVQHTWQQQLDANAKRKTWEEVSCTCASYAETLGADVTLVSM